MIKSAVQLPEFAQTLISSDEFTPFPRYSDRRFWNSIDPEIICYYTEEASKLRDKKWQLLPARRYMDFFVNGDRSRYEEIYFERRRDLVTLFIGECITGNGELIPDITDLAWAICEESSWVVPAHNAQPRGPRDLPDIEEGMYIDLFAAETGSAVAWMYYFLGDEIAKYSPVAAKRIKHELRRRIVKPFLDTDMGWMGFSSSAPVNNWNPWINSNILSAALVLPYEGDERARAVIRTGISMQRFLDSYHSDGGCDEGPSYFTVAGASLFDWLEELSDATAGNVNFWSEPLIQNIALYIMRVHISKSYHVNFADAPARVNPDGELLKRVGIYAKSEELVNFGEYLSSMNKSQFFSRYGQLYRLLKTVTTYSSSKTPKQSAELPLDFYFDGIQVATSRYTANSAEDDFFAAFKGGHNNESHNHNDIGSFIIYSNGDPKIIDAGVGTYTKKTFSSERYDIWTMQSSYHNLPDINGYAQEPGGDFRASKLEYSADGIMTHYKMELSDAYPMTKQSLIGSFVREFTFDRAKKEVVMHDRIELIEYQAPSVMHLMLRDKPEISQSGEITVDGLSIVLDANAFKCEVEQVVLDDKKLAKDWNTDSLYRVNLECLSNDKLIDYTIKFTWKKRSFK